MLDTDELLRVIEKMVDDKEALSFDEFNEMITTISMYSEDGISTMFGSFCQQYNIQPNPELLEKLNNFDDVVVYDIVEDKIVDGDEWVFVIKHHDTARYLKMIGDYNSYEGKERRYVVSYEVEPKQVTMTEYNRI